MQTVEKLGRYEVLGELGRGSMGAVFRARDPRIDRIVAVKTISVAGADLQNMREYRLRFFHEAQAAGRLSHPGIVTIFDVDQDAASNTPFIVMEHVEGKPLDGLVAAAPDGKLPLETAVDLVQQVAAALDYAHAHGIIHRDIKPSNILVTAEGQAKIADFGIAKLPMIETTLPGHLVGTPAYMSPEQLSGKPVDGRSDIFSLGVIAYWLLTGEKPFTGESITEVSIHVATSEPRSASELAPGLDSNFDYVLARGLAKDPAGRYQHAKIFSDDLQDVAAGRPPRSRPSTVTMASMERTVKIGTFAKAIPVQKPVRSGHARRRAFLYYVLAPVVLLLVAAGLFALSSSPAMPARLQVVGQYPFHNGQIYIWVDGGLRYHEEVRGATRSRENGNPNSFSSADGVSIDITLPIRAGRHTVRVQVDAPGNFFDHDTAIPGQFRAFSQRALQLDFTRRRLELKWE